MSQPATGTWRIEPYDRAKHGDGPARVIEDVYREFGFTWDPGGYHHDVLHPEEAYAPPEGLFEVAVEGDEVIGTVGGTQRDGVAELKRLYLREVARGKGIGRALLDRFLQWAQEHGCERAILWSDKRFTDAHRLYGRAGFQVMAERVCDDPDKSPEFGYRLELPARDPAERP
jgi:GNAT superfamily N-acetyltransferase